MSTTCRVVRLVILLLRTVVCHHDDMNENDRFKRFVKTLGPYASHYTPTELRQLHTEVRRLAQALLVIHQAGVLPSAPISRSPQTPLDEPNSDRTLKTQVNEHADRRSHMLTVYERDNVLPRVIARPG